MADNIREFVTSLGFEVDASSQKKFLEALNSISASAEKLSASVAGAATATVHAVQEMSDSLEQLFYSSQRAGTGAAELQAMSFGFQQIGLGAHSAKEALAAFNLAMVSNPGTEALFTAITGKSTRDAAGRMRDTKAMYRELSRELDKQPEFLAIQRAGQFGLDPATYLQQRRNRPQEEAAEARLVTIQQQLGVSTQQATVRAGQWNTALRDLWGVFDTLGIKIKEDMQTKSLPALTAVHDYVMNHLPSIRTVLDKIEVGFDAFAAAAIASGKRVYASFANDEKFQGDLKRLEASFSRVGRAINDAVGKKDGKGIWEQFEEDLEKGIKASTIQLTHFNDGLVTVIKAAKDVIKGDWAGAWEEFGSKSGDAFKAWHDQWEQFKNDWGTSNLPWTLPLQGLVELLNSADDGLKSLSDRLGNSAAVQWIKQKFGDATLTMSSGSGEAGISPQMSALTDMIADMESGKDPHRHNLTPGSTAYGYTQFTSPTWQEYESAIGHKADRDSLSEQKRATDWLIKKEWTRRHPGADTDRDLLDPKNQLAFFDALKNRFEVLNVNRKGVHPGYVELLKRLDAENMAHGASVGMQNFGMGADAGGMPVGKTAPTVHQTNNITNKVDASGHKDPHAAGDSILRVLPRANAQLSRDLGAQVVGPAFGGT